MIRDRDELLLDAAAADLMVRAAHDAWPEEAVGVLGGIGRHIVRADALTNLWRGRRPPACLADPFEQYLAERDLARHGLTVAGTFHSHPDGGPAPSPADIEESNHRHLVIVAMHPAAGEGHEATAEIAAWRIEDRRATQLRLVRVEHDDDRRRTGRTGAQRVR